MADCQVDPALAPIGVVIEAVGDCFSPTLECPPVGGGSLNVRFLAGDGPALATFDSHSREGRNCGEPFIWVRAGRRYRTKTFPNPIATGDCELPSVVPIEVGVGRCAVVALSPSWEDYQAEAERSLDDAWRIERALCLASARLRNADAQHLTAYDTIVPYGPEGGIIAWIGTIYVSY